MEPYYRMCIWVNDPQAQVQHPNQALHFQFVNVVLAHGRPCRNSMSEGMAARLGLRFEPKVPMWPEEEIDGEAGALVETDDRQLVTINHWTEVRISVGAVVHLFALDLVPGDEDFIMLREDELFRNLGLTATRFEDDGIHVSFGDQSTMFIPLHEGGNPVTILRERCAIVQAMQNQGA